MMKYLMSLLLFFSFPVFAHEDLKFDKSYIQCIDKWIAIESKSDSTYLYGFVYFDNQAGLTFKYEGSFKIIDKEYIPKKLDSTSIRLRLEPNRTLVAEIPEQRFDELLIEEYPEWIIGYYKDSSKVESKYRKGFTYNAWGECEKALALLENAFSINPQLKGLAVELSYSYNCLKQYQKAEMLLVSEMKQAPENAFLNKEYIYTLANQGKIDDAIVQYNWAKNNIKNDPHKAENCFNILGQYYYQKDKVNFNKWYKNLKKIKDKKEKIVTYADRMYKELNS